MRIALAVLMALHGIAHLPGFVASWRLATLEGVSYHTTVLAGAVDVGDAGERALGVFWLLTALAFCVAAAAAVTDRTWWETVALGAVLASLVLCALEWPLTRIGVAVNLLILGALIFGRRVVWA